MPHRCSFELPPLTDRLATGRPVITRDQALQLSKAIVALSHADEITVTVVHTVKSLTRLASDRIRSIDHGETLRVGIRSAFGQDKGFAYLQTNQIDDVALRSLVQRADDIGRHMIGRDELIQPRMRDEQDTYLATRLWHDASVDALSVERQNIPTIVDTVRQVGMHTYGAVGVMARAEAVLTEQGIAAFSDETDCEVSVTARSADGSATGWSGVAARDWATIDVSTAARDAAEMGRRNANPQALEPGRRTAILGPAAVVQLMRFLALHFSGGASDDGETGFSKVPKQHKGSRFHEQLFDKRITITTDPADPEGGFRPWFLRGYASHPTVWVDGGVLKSLAYGLGALGRGKAYTEMPYGFRLHGGETSLEQMIAQCDDGVYVNRLSSMDVLDWNTGMTTGVTRDGCFLVRHGKIDRPIKNFRVVISPFDVLRNVLMLGQTARAAFGSVPWTIQEKVKTQLDTWSEFFDWPRRPMVVPPLMVRDFNFSTLIDAV